MASLSAVLNIEPTESDRLLSENDTESEHSDSPTPAPEEPQSLQPDEKAITVISHAIARVQTFSGKLKAKTYGIFLAFLTLCMSSFAKVVPLNAPDIADFYGFDDNHNNSNSHFNWTDDRGFDSYPIIFSVIDFPNYNSVTGYSNNSDNGNRVPNYEGGRKMSSWYFGFAALCQLICLLFIDSITNQITEILTRISSKDRTSISATRKKVEGLIILFLAHLATAGLSSPFALSKNFAVSMSCLAFAFMGHAYVYVRKNVLTLNIAEHKESFFIMALLAVNDKMSFVVQFLINFFYDGLWTWLWLTMCVLLAVFSVVCIIVACWWKNFLSSNDKPSVVEFEELDEELRKTCQQLTEDLANKTTAKVSDNKKSGNHEAEPDSSTTKVSGNGDANQSQNAASKGYGSMDEIQAISEPSTGNDHVIVEIPDTTELSDVGAEKETASLTNASHAEQQSSKANDVSLLNVVRDKEFMFLTGSNIFNNIANSSINYHLRDIFGLKIPNFAMIAGFAYVVGMLLTLRLSTLAKSITAGMQTRIGKQWVERAGLNAYGEGTKFKKISKESDRLSVYRNFLLQESSKVKEPVISMTTVFFIRIAVSLLFLLYWFLLPTFTPYAKVAMALFFTLSNSGLQFTPIITGAFRKDSNATNYHGMGIVNHAVSHIFSTFGYQYIANKFGLGVAVISLILVPYGVGVIIYGISLLRAKNRHALHMEILNQDVDRILMNLKRIVPGHLWNPSGKCFVRPEATAKYWQQRQRYPIQLSDWTYQTKHVC